MKITNVNYNTQKQQEFTGFKRCDFDQSLKRLLEAKFGTLRAAELLKSTAAKKLDSAIENAVVKEGNTTYHPVISIYESTENKDSFVFSAYNNLKKRICEVKLSSLVDSEDCFDQLRLNMETAVAFLNREDDFVLTEMLAKTKNKFQRNPESTAQAELRQERQTALSEEPFQDY